MTTCEHCHFIQDTRCNITDIWGRTVKHNHDSGYTFRYGIACVYKARYAGQIEPKRTAFELAVTKRKGHLSRLQILNEGGTMTALGDTIMPWGKYRGETIDEIPSSYLKWFLDNNEEDDLYLAIDEEYQWREERNCHIDD